MNYFLFFIFTFQSILFIKWSFKYYFRLISIFSFFNFSYIGMIYFGFFSLVFIDPYPFEQNVITWALLYAIILHLFAFWGFTSKVNLFKSSVFKSIFPNFYISDRKVVFLAIFYCIVGFYFFYQYYSLPEELLLREHSGITVLFLFFSKVVYVGYALLLSITLKRNELSLKLLSSLVFLIIISILLFRLKRTETLLFLSSSIFIFYYVKGFQISRKLLFLGGILFFLFATFIKELRQTINFAIVSNEEVRLEELSNTVNSESFYEKFVRAPEVRYAVSILEVSSDRWDFSWGAIHWNRLINLFVPGQLIGADLKEKLKFNVDRISVYEYYGVDTFSTGLMNTIIAESFLEFWILGVVFIFVLFNFFKKLSLSFYMFNNVYYLSFVSLITPYAVVLSGSGSALFVGGSLFYLFYLLPCRLLAKL